MVLRMRLGCNIDGLISYVVTVVVVTRLEAAVVVVVPDPQVHPHIR